MSGTQLKRWVKVLSTYKPTEAEIRVLGKGLNFAIAPAQLPVKDIVIATEIACKKLEPEEAEKSEMKWLGLSRAPNHHSPISTKKRESRETGT